MWVKLEHILNHVEDFLGCSWELSLEVNLLHGAVEALDVLDGRFVTDIACVALVQVTKNIENNLKLVIFADNILLRD